MEAAQNKEAEAVTAVELPRTGDAGPVWDPVAPKIAGADAARAGTMSWTKAGVLILQSSAPVAEQRIGVAKPDVNLHGTQPWVK